MRSASREAMTALRDDLGSVTGQSSSAEDMTTVAEDVYAVADLLVAQPRLRRRLADPAVAAEQRTGLATTLLEGKIGAPALAVTASAVSQRWSSAWDLVDGLELAGDEVLLAVADSEGVIDSVEDELFRLERILDNESNLTTLLDEATVDPARRADLIAGVLDGKAHPLTVSLVRHAVATQRKRSILLAIDDLIEAAGTRRERSVARVLSAVELTDQQQGALSEKLSQMYGRRIEVRTAIEPTVRGGLVIRVGDEIIDGSVATRLAQIRSAFAN